VLATFVGSELRSLVRDEMTRAMLLYPIVLGGFARLLHAGGAAPEGVLGATEIVLVVLAAGFDFGMIVGFSMLDDRDDGVFLAISISPVPLELYIWFKVAFAALLAGLVGLATVLISDSFDVAFAQMLPVVLLAALQVPVNALLITVLAADRAEGIGAAKLTGVLVLCPVAAWFLTDWRQWLFAVVPGFWPAKAVQSLLPGSGAGPSAPGLGFDGYLAVGFLWCALLTALLYAVFRRRNGIAAP
jgi:fluoroquinolone transport system permease protein